MRRHLPFVLLILLFLLIIWDIPYVPKYINEPHLEIDELANQNQTSPTQASHKHLSSLCPFCEGEPVIRPNESSDDLPDILNFLTDHGYYKGQLNAVYNKDAVDAVKSFQLDQKLTPDGIIGEKTWEAIARSASSPSASVVKPDTKNLSIFIDLWQRQLTLFADGKPFKVYPIAIGKGPTPSPVGQWKITAKLYMGGAFGPRFLKLSVPWGNYGIHGTNKPWSIGRAESAGCIRLHNNDILELFSWVSNGTPVTIYDGPYAYGYMRRPVLQNGSVGSAVYEVQVALKEMGLITFNPDGFYGAGTMRAIQKLQTANGLPATGTVSGKVYDLLGLYLFD